jgi:hypothetical protein
MSDKAKTIRGAYVTAYKNRRTDVMPDIVRRYASERGMSVARAGRILEKHARRKVHNGDR